MREPKLPEAGEYVPGLGRVISVEDIQPPPPPPVREWVVEVVTAEVEVRLNGKPLRHVGPGSFCDANFGEGSCIETAIREARKYCEREHIAGDGRLEVVVVKVIEYRRMVADASGEADYYGYRRLNPKSRVFGSGDVPETLRAEVWSSRGEVDDDGTIRAVPGGE